MKTNLIALEPRKVQAGVSPLKEVRNIIAVGSGKGGVGKSTVTAYLARALSRLGAKVGILDADIYGPNQLNLLGIPQQLRPHSIDGKKIQPLLWDGIQSMSIAYLVEQDTAMIWRGPMVSQAVQQLLFETMWTDLDYLIVDLPPGTGDIQLTLAQKIPVSGVVVVTTPQELALADALRAVKMFEKVNMAILGLVENMSHYICSHCGEAENIFGPRDAVNKMASDLKLPLLASFPLDIKLANPASNSVPHSARNLDVEYNEFALKLVEQLSLRPRDYSSKFPKIVIE